MMWHFYEIPYIPDLELVKYQSLGEQGIDGILERHNRFLRQWQRNTVLIHTTENRPSLPPQRKSQSRAKAALLPAPREDP